MPPKNTLGAELKWLYTAKPFLPPTAPIVAYDPDAPLGSAILSQPSPFAEDLTLPNNDTAPARTRGVTQPTPRVSRTLTVDIHRIPSEKAEEVNMARLRATPAKNKPRLMVAGFPTATERPVPVGSALNKGYSRRNSGSSDVPIPERSTARENRAGTHDIEAIDLTGLGGRHPPIGSNGRKRKSDEYEVDAGRAKSPRPAKTIPVSSPSTDYDGFANIDDVMTSVPESPPPPYSTTAINERSANVDEEDVDMDVVAPPASSNRKRKSLIRVASDVSAPSRKLGRIARSPSPSEEALETRSKTPNRRVKNEVLDSEDEEFDSFDGLDLDHMSAEMPDMHEESHPKSVERSSQLDLPIRSPSKAREDNDRPKIEQNSLVTPEATQSPKRTVLSPANSQPAPPSTIQPASRSSASGLSKDEKARISTVVETFLNSEGSRLKLHIESAVATWAKAKHAYLKHAEAGTSAPVHQEAVKRANTQKKALEELLSLKPKYEDLAKKRQALWEKIEVDIGNSDFNPDDSHVLHMYVNSLADVQVQMYDLLKHAGLEKYAEMPDANQDRAGIVIKSTQATPVAGHSRTSHVSGPDHVPQTQCIKQTQISKHEIWTPTRRIRFAETHIVESTPPPLDWNRSARPHTGLIDNRRLQADQNARQPFDTRRRVSPTLHLQQEPKADSSGPIDLSDDDDDDDDFGHAFDVDDVTSFNGVMGAAPELMEEEFCDEDDDDLFDQLSNIENRPSGAFDWKGDKVESRTIQQKREAVQEASSNKVAQRKAPAPPSPKKPQLFAPGMNHPWSKEVRDVLLYKFRLRGFRPGQLEAVNTTLGGEHCFVLMPTGGGKSLCYQLPSVIKSGKTRGVTIVVSPLLSLMEDQVAACRDRFGMQAFLINGESTAEEKRLIMDGLTNPEPQDFIQVLYVTPEMLSKNQRMIDALLRLHKRDRLARIVIDEAHCVSQWGHDFRPDYKALGDVLRQFSGVPVIALTATATQLVRTDVMANLGIRGCRLFSQSFNRPNLSYSVLAKPKNIVQNIADLIKSEFPRKCGIVYCLSRKSCETVAKKLTDLGISAYHYHAGMDSADRSDVQRKWQANKYHVIVATIAFGMGIDKADVRFVIHHSLPKSLEGYYQETGRAGRDGKKSKCYLYYNYGDCKILKKMIDEGEGSWEQKQRQHDMLRNVIQFCENKSDCRRVQVLSYFSEPFKKEDCDATCDNCTSDATFEEKDLSRYAQKAIELVKKVHESNVTVLQCVDAFRGAKNAKIKKADIDDCYGFGSDLERGDVERVFNHLLEHQALKETSVSNKMGFATNYIHPGPRSREYASGNKLFSMQVRVTPRKKIVGRLEPKKKTTKPRAEYPSTNVSSPVRPTLKKNLKHYIHEPEEEEDYYGAAPHPTRGASRLRYDNDFVVPEDDNDEDYNEDSDFAPVREARAPAKRTKQKPSSVPITADRRLAGLDDLQKDILDAFMKGAKSLIQKIKLDRGLKYAPFSDTILRELFLNLPNNIEEMLSIPSINVESVKLYGKLFLKLINNSRDILKEAGYVPGPRHLVGQAQSFGDEDYFDEDDEERPADPNHRVVVDLCGDDSGDEQYEAQIESESVVTMDDYVDDEDDETVHTSHFFDHQVNPDVEAFNRQFSQVEATKPNARSKAQTATRSAAPRAGSTRPPFRKKGGYKKRASGSFGKSSYGGVAKRGASKAPTARKATDTGGPSGTRRAPSGGASSRRPGGGGGGGTGGGGGAGCSSIMAMPT